MNKFTGDMFLQGHARSWALSQWSDPEMADRFVDWLLTLDVYEQARICDRGYLDSGARDDFELTDFARAWREMRS